MGAILHRNFAVCISGRHGKVCLCHVRPEIHTAKFWCMVLSTQTHGKEKGTALFKENTRQIRLHGKHTGKYTANSHARQHMYVLSTLNGDRYDRYFAVCLKKTFAACIRKTHGNKSYAIILHFL